MTGTAYGSSTVKRRRRSSDELEAIDRAIVEALVEDHPATVRGVFYRVLSTGLIAKAETEYRRIGSRLLKLRREGTVPYSWITDGTRWVRKPDSYGSIQAALEATAATYKRALWESQPAYVEIYAEKDAISGLLYGVTADWDVHLGVLRGYASESFAYSVAEHIAVVGKPTWIYQFGDHDPSGVDQLRDFERKIRAFAPGADIEVVRAAVTPAQIEAWNLPTRPTKTTDSRSRGFTGESVEVDAIPPRDLRDLAAECIRQHVDPHALMLNDRIEQNDRDLLASIAAAGGDV